MSLHPKRYAHNLGCARKDGLYRPPNNASVVIHRVKTAAAMRYVFSVVHGGETHRPKECRRNAGSWNL